MTQLRFWNRSDAPTPPDIVLFQEETGKDRRVLPRAWRVIRRCGKGCYHPFFFAHHMEVTVSDYYGNYSPHLPVQLGSNYTVSPQTSGRRMDQDGTALQCHTLSVVNRLSIGALDVHLLRTGRIVASKAAIAPGQKALLTPTSSISVASCYGVAEGAFIVRENLVGIRQFYNLNAIASADIVMAGGGCTTDSVAFQFHLENVVTY